MSLIGPYPPPPPPPRKGSLVTMRLPDGSVLQGLVAEVREHRQDGVTSWTSVRVIPDPDNPSPPIEETPDGDH